MKRELFLNFDFGDNGSAREVRDFGQAIEYTGKNTEETAGKLSRFQDALTGVGKKLLLQKGAATGLAAALSSLKIEPLVNEWLKLSSAQDMAGKSFQQAVSSFGSPIASPLALGTSSALRGSQIKGIGENQSGWNAGVGVGSTIASTGAGYSAFENVMSGSTLTSTLGAGLPWVTGPLVAMADSLMGALMNKVQESEPEIPSFQLLWKTIDGQIEQVAETWQNMGRDKRIVDAAEAVWQSQLDFVKKLALVAGGEEIPSFEFSLSGVAGVGSSIENILKQQTSQGLIKVALGSYGQLSEVFGPGFQEELKKVFMDTISQNLGMYTFGQNKDVLQNYMNWKFNQFTSLPSDQAMSESEAWMSSQAIFSPVGRPGIQANSIFDLFLSRYPGTSINEETFPQLEQFAKTVTHGWFSRGEIALNSKESQEPWQDFFGNLDQQVNDIFNLVTAGMGQAFAASLKTGEFETFEQNFKQSILSSVQQSLVKGFAEQELLPIVFQPFYGNELRPALSEVLQQYMNGDMPLSQTQDYLTQMAGELTSTLQGFEPVWETLNTAFGELSQALGINTTAVGQNTDAILGPVNTFLMSLDTGSLASTESMAGLENLKSQLYTSALADPTEFSTYAGFMTSQYLPWLQGVSSDYGAEIANVRAGVESIPWVQDARGYTSLISEANGGTISAASTGSSAQDIGQEVSRVLGPMLLDLKESGQITINVVIDGQIIRQKVIDSLDDPAVVQKARTRI